MIEVYKPIGKVTKQMYLLENSKPDLINLIKVRVRIMFDSYQDLVEPDPKPDTYTVNIYRYKAIGANATSSVISTTWKCISPCLEIL